MSDEPLKITLQAWRIFSLLEEANDPSVGRSLAFISDNLRAYTPTVIDQAIGELLQADLIEPVNDMNRYRLNRAPELTIRESFLLSPRDEEGGQR